MADYKYPVAVATSKDNMAQGVAIVGRPVACRLDDGIVTGRSLTPTMLAQTNGIQTVFLRPQSRLCGPDDQSQQEAEGIASAAIKESSHPTV